jgi:hypothetical protein
MWIFERIRKKKSAPASTVQSSIVAVDDDKVSCWRPNGSVESVTWAELQAVLIHTTGDGPFVDDLFWVLAGQRSRCVIPDTAQGVDLLLEQLQQLPGFQNEVLIEAMSSTTEQMFLCWQKKNEN